MSKLLWMGGPPVADGGWYLLLTNDGCNNRRVDYCSCDSVNDGCSIYHNQDGYIAHITDCDIIAHVSVPGRSDKFKGKGRKYFRNAADKYYS